MVRKIIKIDEDKHSVCGLCVSVCHEGAIGIEHAVKTALKNCGKPIPAQVVTIAINGRVLET